jgi:hypothetical protein
MLRPASMTGRTWSLAFTVALALAALVAASAAAAPPRVTDTPIGGTVFGSQCASRHPLNAKARCYEKFLLADIERSHDPARELPNLDAETRAAGGFIAGACHGLMHAVGREYAIRHHVTLGSLQRYLPKSNDPGCSAGFGHGLIMALGPQIVRLGPRGVLRTCMHLATRMQQYSCVHGLGHAYMRVYGEYLRYALPACLALGPKAAPDCAQGAFHDYWIASTGRDATKQHPGLVTSARVLCGSYKRRTFVLACWYRYYIERPPAAPVGRAADIDRLCARLQDIQRAGCIAGASLSAATADPFALAALCRGLHGNDPVNCLRAVPVEEVSRFPSQQLRLIHTCARLHGDTRSGCDRWFGKTLTVVTNGSFRHRCVELRATADRRACRAGARSFGDPLVTFA